MPKTRVSMSRSESDVATPKRKKSRGSRSVCSPALSTASGRLTSLIDQFKDKNRQSFALSPLNSKSVLNDNTDIEEPRRKSWWKKLNENSQAVMEVLEEDKVTNAHNLIEDLIDIEVLSQEKKNFTLDLPDSSDNESINSIVLPQRKLFTQKENQAPKNFGQLIGNRESLAKLHKTNTTNIDKAVNVGKRELFQNVKRSKPIFPTALLQLSPNKTAADKTKENLVIEPKPQIRNIFGNRPNNKRKNIFAEFIVSESEDEMPDIQPKVFGFQKKLESRRISSISKGKDTSPTSSITTDIEMDDWKHLPSSTMVDNQLEDMLLGHTPRKRTRLSKLSEAKESEAGTNTLQTNTTSDKTKQSNKSTTSKNKSKSSPQIKDKTLDNSRTTRSMAKNTSLREELHNTSRKQDTKVNKSQNKTIKEMALDDSLSTPKGSNKQTTLNKSLKQNLSRARNDTKATENGNEMESDKNVIRAINDETKVIRKSSIKNMSSTITNKSVNKEDIEMNTEESTNGHKIQNKSNKTGSNNVNNNEENDDDDQNFTLQYDKDEPVVNVSVLEKMCQKDETNKSRSNKSLSKIQNQETTSVKPAESQQNEQNTTDDKVDGIRENNHDTEIELNQESKHNNSNQIGNELNKDVENDEVNESEENQNNINKSNEKANVSHEIGDEHKVTIESQEIPNESEDEEGNVTGVNENEVNAREEVEEISNASGIGEDETYISTNEANVSEEVEGEANASEEDEEEANASEEDEEEANASEEDEEKANESDQDEGNKSQEVEDDVNESQEEAHVSQTEEIEGEENESHVSENDNASDEENHEEIEEDEDDKANESQEVVNENDVESEADVSDSKEVENNQEMDDTDDADKAIATDAETSVEDDNDEMEVDDEHEPHEASNEHKDVEETEENPVEQNEIEPSDELIEESPDVTHDTTGRNRKKDLNKSPEAVLDNRTNQMDSFTANGRNTSVRKTKSMIKNLNIRPSLAPPRDSIGFSDGTTNSSAEGSGWDSHRTTRKTLRQTFGKDFTPRKSLRALVMEKSAKRHTEHIDLHSETVKFPQANSTEFPENSTRDVEDVVESDHEISRRTRQTTLETYLHKIKQQNMNLKLKMEETVRNSLKGPTRDSLSLFKVPNKPAPRRPKPTQNKPKKQIKSIIPLDELPSEVIADMKYKPPKRFQPTNASWITKRLYKFLENKLEARYDYKARLRAEKLVEKIYYFAKDLRRHNVAPVDAVDVLKHELARLDIVRTHFEFYEFFHEFMPREIRVKVVPDIVNNIPLPRHGVFSDIIRGMQG